MVVVEATLCHIIRGDELLLKKATRGFSVGKWNGPGGKVEPGEAPEDCAKREVFEETGLRVSDLLYHGTLSFAMGGKRAIYLRGRLFSTHKASGRMRASEEGPVKWFSLAKLPFDEMWEDDLYWLPLMLRGVKFNATFRYDAANRHVTSFEITSP
jgi:8-oxo-dGTP diphosphatase